MAGEPQATSRDTSSWRSLGTYVLLLCLGGGEEEEEEGGLCEREGVVRAGGCQHALHTQELPAASSAAISWRVAAQMPAHRRDSRRKRIWVNAPRRSHGFTYCCALLRLDHRSHRQLCSELAKHTDGT